MVFHVSTGVFFVFLASVASLSCISGHRVYLEYGGSIAWDGSCNGMLCQSGAPCSYPTSVFTNESCEVVFGTTVGFSMPPFALSLDVGALEVNLTGSSMVETGRDNTWSISTSSPQTQINVFGLDALFQGHFTIQAKMVKIANSNFRLAASSTQRVEQFAQLVYQNVTVEKSSAVDRMFVWNGDLGSTIDATELNVLKPSYQAVVDCRQADVTIRRSKINATSLFRVAPLSPPNCPNWTFEDSEIFSPFNADFTMESLTLRNTIIGNQDTGSDCPELWTYYNTISNIDWVNVTFQNFGIGTLNKLHNVSLNDVRITCINDFLLSGTQFHFDTSSNGTLSISKFKTPPTSNGTPSLSIQQPLLAYSDIQNLEIEAAGSTCPFALQGNFVLLQPLSFDDFCITGRSKLITLGESIEVRNRVASTDGIMTIWEKYGEPMILHSVQLDGINATIDRLIYVPSVPNVGITEVNGSFIFSLGEYAIDWQLPTPPLVGQTYPLASNVVSFGGLYGPFEIGRFNIASSYVRSNVHFQFGTVPCNTSCITSNVASSVCVDSLRCPCLPSFGGPLCACNQTDIPSGIVCSPQGYPTWISPTDFYLPHGETLNLPKDHSFEINGNASIQGNFSLMGTSSLKSSGELSAGGILRALCKLKERHVPGIGCSVYSTVTLLANSLTFSDVTKIQLDFDISELSVDGSCTQPDNIDIFGDSTFKSLTTTLMQSGAVWNISFFVMEGSNARREILANSSDLALVKFQTSLLSSSDTGKSFGTSTTLLAESPSPSTCTNFKQSPGLINLFVADCPANSPKKQGSSVKWWYYGIPIIAVAAIVIVVLIIVFTVRPVHEAVMPYRGEGSRI